MARAMKDSGIEWIGEIPVGWKVDNIKRHFSVIAGATPKSENREFWDGDIPWITPADYKTRDKFISGGKRNITQAGYDSCGTTLIPRGSIVFSKRAPVGTVAIANNELCTNQGCLSCVVKDGSVPDYYYYAMSAFTEQFELLSTGTTFKEIAADVFANFRLPAPSIAEQQNIADFLDTECARIDAVIEQTRASIEEYKKLKQSVITQTVTKGIRPGRKMKDSGVEWIGEMPEEWAIIPFRHVLKERVEKNIPVKSTERLSLSIDLGVTLYSEKITNLDRFKDDFEQYKIAHVGDLVMNSMNMIVGATGVSDYYGCISPAYYTFYDDAPDHITAKYCEYIFRSKTMLRVLFSLGKGIYAIVRGDDRVNTCRLKLSREDLRQIEIPLPNVEEQREIVQYLCKKTQEIDDLIKQKNEIISELESYKKSLIFEYVTGKKEVI